MSYKGHSVLAVVPARGGSKGIPLKNLRELGGKPLIGHAAEVVQALDWIDHAVISTDHEEMARVARQHGLDAPFLRPPELATDTSTAVDAWRHAWLACEEHYGMRFELSLLLEPTSPMRTPQDLERCVSGLLDGGYDAAATVSRTPAHFSPHKTLTVGQDQTIGFYLQDGASYSIRQKIPAYYHRNGLCYAVRRETLVTKGRIIEHNCLAVVVDRHVVNIDDEHELEYAEFLLAKERE